MDTAKDSWIKFIKHTQLGAYTKELLLQKRVIEETPEYYFNYILIFSENFAIDKKKLAALCNIGMLCYGYAIITDTKEDYNINSIHAIKSQKEIFNELQNQLKSIFPTNSLFWHFFKLRVKHFGMVKSLDLKCLKKPSFTKYKKLSYYKSSLGNLAIDAIFCLLKKEKSEEHLLFLKAHYDFSLALQIIDDIKDFKEDFKLKQFNICHYKLNVTIENQNIELLTKQLYLFGIAKRLYARAIKYLDQVTSFTKRRHLTRWEKINESITKKLRRIIIQSNAYIEALVVRNNLKNAPKKFDYSQKIKIDEEAIVIALKNPVHQLKLLAIKYLIEEAEKDFSEMKHIMFLDSSEGFKSKNNIHIGDVFQKAIVAETLLDYQAENSNINFLLRDLENFFNKNITREGSIIGWKYFPSVVEISCDIDDLAQILRFILKFNRKNKFVKATTKVIDDVILKDNFDTHANAFQTWILPHQFRTELQEKQGYFNKSKWGEGPHVEVNANFGICLIMLDFKKYAFWIKKIGQYLKSTQTDDGFWVSRWYYGNYYGTYIGVKFLTHLPIFKKQVLQAIDFIYKTQNKDGGWGGVDGSDPLNTAFAILTLSDCACLISRSELSKKIKDAVRYLQNAVESDGGWMAVDFIFPRVNNPYKSRTTTTAFVVKALLSLNYIDNF